MSKRIAIQLESDGAAERRFVVDSRRLRLFGFLAVSSLLFLMLAAAAGSWKLTTMQGNSLSAEAENAVLRGQLQGLEARLTRVDQALERVMANDAKLRQLSQEDESARAFGLESLSALELAAAERQGRTDVGIATNGDMGPIEVLGAAGELEAVEARARELESSLLDEEESMQEVRGYLDDRWSLTRAHPTVWPVRGWMTSRYGYRQSPQGEGRRLHAGIDIAAPRGTPVVAPADGHVVYAGYHTAYGNLVVIDHGYGLSTKYGHLSRINVRVGARIQRSEVLGRVGSTGRSTGPHLHFEVHQDGAAVNPLRYLDRDQN